MNICKYTPTKYLDNGDINARLRFLFKNVCYLLAESGGDFDSTVEFTVNTDPNDVGTVFSPNTPELTTVIYVDNTGTASNGAQWTWNGAAYVLYVAPYWSIHGNSGITTDNYIGTTNTAPLRFKVNNIQSGIIDNTLNNIALGPLSLPITTTGDQNTAFGEFALGSNTDGRNNTALGAYALGSNTSGEYNLALGAGSLQSNTTGTRNTAVGQGALYSTNGTYNVAMGWSALNFNTGTGYNTAVGSFSLRTAGTGTLNSALGYESGQLNTDGANNIFIGNKSGAYNTTVSNQVFINSINRTNYTGDTTQSPIYIQQHATVASQLINFNAGVTTLRGDTTAAKLRFLEPSGSGTNYSEFQAVAQSANITYSLPPTVGAAGTVLTDVAGNGVLTWAAGGSGGANTALSNLAAVAINTSLISDTDNTDDLGSAAIAWKDAYLRRILLDGSTSGTVTVQTAATAGTWTLTLPTTDGNSGELLQTDGSGITSWVDTTTYFSNRFGGAGTVGDPITPIKVTTVVSSASITPDADASTMLTITALATNTTINNPSGTPVDGQDLLIRIKSDATPRTLSWDGVYRAGTDFALPTTTVASETMYIQFIYNIADDLWDAIGLTVGFS